MVLRTCLPYGTAYRTVLRTYLTCCCCCCRCGLDRPNMSVGQTKSRILAHKSTIMQPDYACDAFDNWRRSALTNHFLHCARWTPPPLRCKFRSTRHIMESQIPCIQLDVLLVHALGHVLMHQFTVAALHVCQRQPWTGRAGQQSKACLGLCTHAS